MLDEALLTKLERQWQRKGSRIVEALNPGLTDAEIDDLAAPLGHPIPEEARRWWRWHNGASAFEMVLGRAYSSLEEDVASSLNFRWRYTDWGPRRWVKISTE